MVTTNFKVQKRKISQIDSVPYTGEYNIDTFKFEFDEEWEGLDKTLVFISGDNRYNIALLNDEALMPFEMYQIKGNIQIGLFGTDNGLRTLATGWLPLYIEEDSYEVSVEPENLPSPTQWDLYVTEINRLLELCQASQEQCELIQAQIEEDYEQYLADLNQIKSDTLGYKNDTQALKNETNQIKNDVIGLKNQVESDIADAELRISEYNANAQTKTNQFNQNATEKTNAFNDNASSKTTSFNSNYTEKLGSINTAGSTQVGNVQNAGTTQIGLVNTAGETAVGNVQSAEDTAIENIEEAGESYDVRINQLLDQIPVGTVEEKTINVQDSSNLPIKDIVIKGNTSQDGTPTPSNPVSINVVTGDVTVNLRTENLFNASTGQNGYINDSGSVVSRNYQYASDYIELSEGDYTISGSIVFSNIGYALYDKNKSILLPREDNKNKQSVTVSITNQKYIRFWIDVGNTSGITLNANNVANTYKVQCEKGSTALLSLGNIELCKIGNYQDYLWCDNTSGKWYKHKAIDKAVLDGTQEWYTTDSGTSNQMFWTQLNATKGERSNVPIYANMYKYVYWNNNPWNVDNSISYYQTDKIRVKDTACANKTAFKTFLQENNLIVYYVLATPIEEEITDTTLLSQLNALYELQTYKNVTNMYTTTQNEVPTLNVTYRKDLQTLTDKIALLDARLSLLE